VSDPAAEVSATLGLHHVRLPVSDVMRSRDWYVDVFGFEPLLCLEDEDRVIGVFVRQRGGLTLGLHHAPALARVLNGFCLIGFSVGTLDDLIGWCTRLDALGVGHSLLAEGHLGWSVEVPDPDGLIVELHTIEDPTEDEA
jgi:catechol 2,3-dioxygenase-like lactoylglutathione lyase family enzyme